MARLQRTQILLDPTQHRELSDIARSEERSLSEVVRGIVDGELRRRARASDETLRRRLATLERIREHREEILRERAGEPPELDVVATIREMREERDAELERRIFGDRR